MKNVLYVLLAVVFFACTSQSTEQAEATKTTVQRTVETVEWAEDAIIYEVNIRQFTPEGTFTAFKPHIARLKDLGVDILWIMPIHPIGEKNRKGTLGSYYSVKNYKGVNPDFGTLDDFKTLVEEAHLNGMYVIIDWVANHTAWDHDWINENPDWYAKDSLGNMYYPADWTDVCQLNYDNEELHEGMIDALEYWVEEADIDGYRCDVAGMVPTKFWNKARIALDEIKPVFMLAEDEHTYDLMNSAFDMNYAWHMHHIMNQIAKGEESVKELVHYYERYDTIFPKSVYRMNFITNHDENSWNGTVFERLGDGVKTFAVMSYTIPGMPLIYTGQEAGNSKRLEFFEKDEVDWSNEEYVPFYKSLAELKKENEVFWNGASGGDMEILELSDTNVFAFKRVNADDEAVVLLNLSGDEKSIVLPEGMAGAYKDFFTDETFILNAGEKISLAPWDYKVLF
ncbi:MAG TPA: alpha-amylase [Bacteroidales bacterium]|jgi:glycosidase|nr:alpha-amylase [Bacteroidales bacterium]